MTPGALLMWQSWQTVPSTAYGPAIHSAYVDSRCTAFVGWFTL